VVGGLLRRQRQEAERVAAAFIEAVVRDRIGLDAIVRRLDIGAIVARLDVGAIVARLDMNEVVARIDFPKLTDQVLEDIDLPKAIVQAGTSVVRGRRPRNKI